MRILLALILASAASASGSQLPPTPPAQVEPAKSPVILDAKGDIARFYGVPMNLTLAGLKRMPYRYRFVHSSATGKYKYYKIKAEDHVELEVSFQDGKLDSASTSSRGAIGPNGIGVGSLLSDVKKAWPEGKFNYGFAEHQTFVYFDTKPGFMTGVTYYFEPKDMPAQAFDMDYRKSRDITVPDIRVKTIGISVPRFQEENYGFLALTTGPCAAKAETPIAPKQRSACQRMTQRKRYRGTWLVDFDRSLFAPAGQPSCDSAKAALNCAQLLVEKSFLASSFRPRSRRGCPQLLRVEFTGRRNLLPGSDPAYRIILDELLAYSPLPDLPHQPSECAKLLPNIRG